MSSSGKPPAYDRDGVERDSRGRKVPTRLNLVSMNRAVPGLLDQFTKEVPSSFICGYGEASDGRRTVTIECPCGERPEVTLAASKACSCNRLYANLGSRIRVTNISPS